MLLWTVQPNDVWHQIKSEGAAIVNPFRVNLQGWIHPQYAWLAIQLREHIHDASGNLPWFAYCERPDLRWVRHSRPKGSAEVLIEFEPPTESFVSFPSWAWGEVFCSKYLSFTAAKARNWEQRVKEATGHSYENLDDPLPAPFQHELEQSWRLLFLQNYLPAPGSVGTGLLSAKLLSIV